MQYRKLILATAVLTVSATTAVLASQSLGHGPGGMALADLDGDGVITTEEIQARHAERFQAADSNGDGTLDIDEVRNAMLRQRAQRRVEALDTNGDGVISAEEYQAPMRWHLSRMDRDGDGEISRYEKRRKAHQRWDDDDDHGPRRHRHDD